MGTIQKFVVLSECAVTPLPTRGLLNTNKSFQIKYDMYELFSQGESELTEVKAKRRKKFIQ